jgi:hypothetical protein
MAIRPHDVTDLYLAPVVLAVDARIEKLGRLGKDGLAYEVALESDSPDFTRRIREDGLIRTVTHPGTRQSRSYGLKQLERALRVAGVVAVGGGDVRVAIDAQQADGQAA